MAFFIVTLKRNPEERERNFRYYRYAVLAPSRGEAVAKAVHYGRHDEPSITVVDVEEDAEGAVSLGTWNRSY